MKQVFVFGSNLAGRHGAGSALEARRKWGALYGQGEGMQGHSYAIPTKDKNLRILPLAHIKLSVERFVLFASLHPEMTFNIVAIGCGLAGYKPEQISPFFAKISVNCHLPIQFRNSPVSL